MSVEKSLGAVRRRAWWVACGAAALSMAALSAHAESEPFEKIVRYADLDLSKTSDAATLYARLERAARSVCRSHQERPLKLQGPKRECEYEALTQAVADVNAATLTALHRSESRFRVARAS